VDGIDSGVRDSGPWPRLVTPPGTASPVRESPVADFPATESPAGPRQPSVWSARIPGPALQGLIALVIYVGVFLLAFGMALIGRLSVPQVGQVYVDPQIFIWSYRWWPYAIMHGLNPLYTTQIGAPAGYNLAAWTPSAPAPALLMWPITALWGPVVSFNLTLLLAPPASAWATFVATRRLTKRFWASLFAGTVYGFTLYEVAHNSSGQVNVCVTLLFPLMVYLVLLWWDGTLGRTGFMIWMAVALALEFYTFSEAYFDVTMVGAAALLIGIAVARRDTRRKVVRLAGLTAIGFVGSLVLASPYLIYELRNMPKGLTRNSPNFELHIVGLILPRADRMWGLPTSLIAFSRANPNAGYVGIPMLVLLLLFAFYAWSNRVARLLVLTFAVTILLGLGSTFDWDKQPLFSLPWGALWNLPIASSVETDRFILFGFLVLAFVVALWLAAPARSRLVAVARWGLVVLALAVVFANTSPLAETVAPPLQFKEAVASLHPEDELPGFITEGLYKQYLTPGEIVVFLSHRGNAGMLFQAETDFYFRVAGGFINASLNPYYGIPAPVEMLSHPTKARIGQFKAWMKATGVGAIVVERDWSEHWMYIFGHLGMRSTTVGGVTVYRVVPAKATA
jgi:hypothetical protein